MDSFRTNAQISKYSIKKGDIISPFLAFYFEGRALVPLLVPVLPPFYFSNTSILVLSHISGKYHTSFRLFSRYVFLGFHKIF